MFLIEPQVVFTNLKVFLHNPCVRASQIYPNNRENIVYLFFNILMISYEWQNTISSFPIIWMRLEIFKGITIVEKISLEGLIYASFFAWTTSF